MARLNLDSDSPFRGAIATPTSPDGYIKDNSVLKMIENSLYDGALYQYRDPGDGTGDIEQMVLHLKIYWSLVESIWPIEWKLIPRKSRLTHGVGIQAIGYVMDALTDGHDADSLPGIGLERRLEALCEVTAWMSGAWDLGPDDQRRWNSLQNTPNDIKLLTNVLIRALNVTHSHLIPFEARIGIYPQSGGPGGPNYTAPPQPPGGAGVPLGKASSITQFISKRGVANVPPVIATLCQ